MTKDEALKLALEALEHLQPTALNSFYTIGARDKAITAIKQALAAPDLKAELDATNRQVEILSDALAESRREVDALVALARADERARLQPKKIKAVQKDDYCHGDERYYANE